MIMLFIFLSLFLTVNIWLGRGYFRQYRKLKEGEYIIVVFSERLYRFQSKTIYFNGTLSEAKERADSAGLMFFKGRGSRVNYSFKIYHHLDNKILEIV